MVLLRHMLGDALRRLRLRQGRTLREVSAAARVSLGYLSEVERGQKEASSELLASICGALGAPLSQVLREVSDSFALAELQNAPVYTGPTPMPGLNGPPAARPAAPSGTPAASAGARRVAVPAGTRLALGPQRKMTVGASRGLIAQPEPALDKTVLERAGRDDAELPVGPPEFDRIRDITNMVPV
jgi:transcriptional regulator with XRE-family HTH domain